jgi:hypothetical protein
VLSRCDVYWAFNLRAANRMAEAVDMLLATPGRYAFHGFAQGYPELQASLILCSQGCIERAKEIMERTGAALPGDNCCQYVPLFVEGDFSKASGTLMRGDNTGSAGQASWAECRIKAGIAMELSGNAGKARRMWRETAGDFPPSQCSYFGSLAQQLADGSDNVEEMPYSAHRRSEMFYFAAMLHEKRGNAARSKQLLQLCVKEDPTLRWPACLARQKLSRTQGARLARAATGYRQPAEPC